jgi:hypothetical protein
LPSANALSTGNVAAAGGTLKQDVVTAGEDFLTVIASLGPTAAAAGDVSVKVVPYLTDLESTDHGNGPTIADAGLALVQSTNDPGVAAYLNATDHIARVMVRVRVSGIERVQLVLTNNNATTALPGRLDFYFD